MIPVGGAMSAPRRPNNWPCAPCPAVPHETLSTREFEVLQLLVAGMSVTAIAAQINLSVKTISTHKANLMECVTRFGMAW